MRQVDLEHAHARSTDLDTSHEAAQSIGPLTLRQHAVYALLLDLGPVPDATLVYMYRLESDLPRQSDSGIRSRRHELVVMGMVAAHGTITLAGGRKHTVWQAIPQGA